jgi:hypothetical protein
MYTIYRLKSATVKNWKAENLWTLLDTRGKHKDYCDGGACRNMKVLIIGKYYKFVCV